MKLTSHDAMPRRIGPEPFCRQRFSIPIGVATCPPKADIPDIDFANFSLFPGTSGKQAKEFANPIINRIYRIYTLLSQRDSRRAAPNALNSARLTGLRCG